MKKKRNNKGFSLVELIVVIAIMAILAVTLAPRLMHYVDKARAASDHDVANSVFNAARLTLADDSFSTAFANNASKVFKSDTETDIISYYVVSLEEFYNVSTDNRWSVNTTKADDNTFYNEMATVIGDFNLKATAANGSGTSGPTGNPTLRNTDDSDIFICYNVATEKLSVILDYSGFNISSAYSTQMKDENEDTHNYVISE